LRGLLVNFISFFNGLLFINIIFDFVDVIIGSWSNLQIFCYCISTSNCQQAKHQRSKQPNLHLL